MTVVEVSTTKKKEIVDLHGPLSKVAAKSKKS